MTIKHFFITAGYAFWAYIMLYIFIKLIIDTGIKHTQHKRIKKIDEFFMCENFHNVKKADIARIFSYAQDNFLFEYICEKYLELSDTFTQHQKRYAKTILKKIIEFKIKKTPERNNLTRCLLIRYINSCSINSPTISKFLSQCKTGCKIERQWISKISDSKNSTIEV